MRSKTTLPAAFTISLFLGGCGGGFSNPYDGNWSAVFLLPTSPPFPRPKPFSATRACPFGPQGWAVRQRKCDMHHYNIGDGNNTRANLFTGLGLPNQRLCDGKVW